MARRKIAVVSLPAVMLEEVHRRRALPCLVNERDASAAIFCKGLPWRDILVLRFNFHGAGEKISAVDIPFPFQLS